jgi:hypothetical protein
MAAAFCLYFLTLPNCDFSVLDFYNERELRLQSCPSVPGPANLETSCQGALPRSSSRSLGGPRVDGQEEERPALLDHSLLGADELMRCIIPILHIPP